MRQVTKVKVEIHGDGWDSVEFVDQNGKQISKLWLSTQSHDLDREYGLIKSNIENLNDILSS
jgi:hypothetical protein